MGKHSAKEILQEITTNGTLYHIASAIRGPDSGKIFLKHIFTCRIRWLAGRSGYIVGAFRSTEKIGFHNIVNAVVNVGKEDYHYLTHVADALNGLLELNLISGKEYDFLYSLVWALIFLTKNDEMMQTYALNRITKLTKEYSEFVVHG